MRPHEMSDVDVVEDLQPHEEGVQPPAAKLPARRQDLEAPRRQQIAGTRVVALDAAEDFVAPLLFQIADAGIEQLPAHSLPPGVRTGKGPVHEPAPAPARQRKQLEHDGALDFPPGLSHQNVGSEREKPPLHQRKRPPHDVADRRLLLVAHGADLRFCGHVSDSSIG